MNNIVVCSLNVGKNEVDYNNLLRFNNEGLEFNKTQTNEFEEAYRTQQTKVMNSLKNETDVFCFQEVYSDLEHTNKKQLSLNQRPIIAVLESDFEIRGFKKRENSGWHTGDTAIALRKNLFTNLVDHSRQLNVKGTRSETFKRDVAIVTATHTLTNERITFVSAHTPGFDLSVEEDPKQSEGNDYCRQIAELISEIGNPCVICADMNGTPEKSPSRFNIFNENKFITHRLGFRQYLPRY